MSKCQMPEAHNLTCVVERLDKLESINNRRISESTLISRRLTEIEQHFSGDYQLVATKLTPHRCPVCDGNAVLPTPQLKIGMTIDMYTGKEICRACEGKGVLWG